MAAADWPWVAATYHQRWLPMATRLEIDGRTVALRPDQALALAGIVLITQISCAVSRWPTLRGPLAHCGVNSLFLLLFHSPVQSVTLKTLAALGWQRSTPAGWVAFAVSVLVSLALARMIRRSAWLGWCFLPPNQVQRRRMKCSRLLSPSVIATI